MKLKDLLKEAVAEISYKKSGLKNPNLADLNKDKKISSWEKKRGGAIEKNMGLKKEFKSQAPNGGMVRFGNEERPMETMPSLSRSEMGAMDSMNMMKYEQDHEVSMAQNSLKAIVSAASELMNKIGEDEKDIPAWIQDHITNAANYIQQASQNYHEYSENNPKDGLALEDLMERKGVDKFGYTQNAQAKGPFRGAQMAMQHPSLNLEKKKKKASK